MNGKIMKLLASILAAFLLASCKPVPPPAKPVIKRFEWGIETWEIGSNDFLIKFNEKTPVRILDIQGDLTAGPQPNYKAYDTLVRQTLATLINPGDGWTEKNVEVEGTPGNRANHVLAPHLFSVNVKQTNGETMDIPIRYTYDRKPIELKQNRLLMRVVNESYRWNSDQGAFVSKDQDDTLNVEIHLTITYEVDDVRAMAGAALYHAQARAGRVD